MSLGTAKRAAPPIPYKWCRPGFKSGDLIAQSHGDWKTWNGIQVLAVRLFTLSTYSHVGVIEVDKTDGRVYVCEAVRPVTHRVPLSTIGDFYHLPLPSKWTYATSHYRRSVMGVAYSKLAAIKAYFVQLAPGTVSQCAAFAIELLLRCGVDLGRKARPDALVQAALEMGSDLTFVRNQRIT
jgi:hypothetical protein